VLDVDTSGVRTYVAWLRAEKARILAEVCLAYRGWAVHIHADIASLSPQWSGNLAANWAIDLNAATTAAQDLGDPSVRSHHAPANPVYGRDPYSRGMFPAVEVSLQRGQAFPMPGLGDQIYIHNPVVYADEVEQDSGDRPIRAVNRLPRGETGKIAMVHYAAVKYASAPIDLQFTRGV
jgi:hypothetical protein